MTRQEIDKRVSFVLRDARMIDPPIRIERLLEHLQVDRHYYDLADPGFVRRLWHRVQVDGHLLKQIARRIKLAAAWLPDENCIFVDEALHARKKEWASFHDTTHTILPWHREFFLGDTAQTLNPDYQTALEREANHGASGLMFCGERFAIDARDCSREWATIMSLHQRYDKSITTTARRFVEWGSDHAVALVIGNGYWQRAREDQVGRHRHFVRSPEFRSHFAGAEPEALIRLVDDVAVPRRAALVADFDCCLTDDGGTKHEFHAQAFSNTYDVLSLFVEVGQRTATRIVVPPQYAATS